MKMSHNVRWIKEEWRTTTARSKRKCSLRHFSFNPFVITSAVKLAEMFNRSKVKFELNFLALAIKSLNHKL